MEFMNREAQFPGKKKLIKVDDNNVPIPNEEPILVNIVKDEGNIYVDGTPLNTENLNKGNWRDDNSISFRKSENNDLPEAKAIETQIVTKANGETWIIPPYGSGGPKEITDPKGSVITVNGIKSNVDFTSHPQAQINSKANQTSLDALSQDHKSHAADRNNPHGVTKTQIGLGDVDNTSDADKPISTAVQVALDTKADLTNGTMSDPSSVPFIDTSIDDAITLLKGMNEASVQFCSRNSIIGNPFPELGAGRQCLCTLVRTSTDIMYLDVTSYAEDNRIQHASRIYNSGAWQAWARPKGWVTIWDNGGLGGTDGTSLGTGFSNGDHLRITAIADSCVSTAEAYVDFRYADGNGRCFVGVPFYHYAGADIQMIFVCYYGLLIFTNQTDSYIAIRRQKLDNISDGLIGAVGTQHRILKIEKEVYV